MQTAHATLILASLQRTPRAFQSYDLNKPARQRVDAVQQLLGEYRHRLAEFDYAGALSRLARAYEALGAPKPAAEADDMDAGTHPMMLAVAHEDHAAETEAWRVFLSELLPH
jgi:hypothetical protein